MPLEVKDPRAGLAEAVLGKDKASLQEVNFRFRCLTDFENRKAEALIDEIDRRYDSVKGVRSSTAPQPRTNFSLVSTHAMPQSPEKDWDRPYVAGMQGFVLQIMGNSKAGFVRDLADQLHAEPPQVVRQGCPGRILDGIVNAIQVENRPVVVATHSLSNNDMLESLLPELRKRGLALDVWVMFDASYLRREIFPLPPKERFRLIPANVRFVVNVYAEGGGFNGRAVNSGDFENPFSKDNPTGTRWVNLKVPGGHLGMATHENAVEVRRRVQVALRYLRLLDAVSNPPEAADGAFLAAAGPARR